MRRPVAILLAILIVAVAWLFFKHFNVSGLGQVRVVPKSLPVNTGGIFSSSSSTERGGFFSRQQTETKKTSLFNRLLGSKKGKSATPKSNSIKIASFNVHAFGSVKASKSEVMEVMADTMRRFDIIAIQELRSDRPDVLPGLVDLMNRKGDRYDLMVGPRLGLTGEQEQYAFVFDRDSVFLDRESTYTVEDPHDLMIREPLVGWFRVIGPDARRAFTFSLVNVRIEKEQAEQELDLLDGVLYAVRNDGRNEDDVIFAGDFCSNHRRLGQLGKVSGLITAIANVPTNTRGDKQCDNIVFQLPATEEFTGRSGVFDFMREYNLSLEQALSVSDHLPVWAEFSALEGRLPGRVAPSDLSTGGFPSRPR